MPSHIDIRAELESDVGAGAGEGARDGGANTDSVVFISTVILTPIRSAVALGGGALIDLHPVIARTTTSTLKYQTVKGEGDFFAIG